MKTDLFQSYGHCWVFQICWHIECSTFKASSFRFWNSSTGIPSPPLTLFVVMFPKAHLTLHSRMSGSRWLITPSWLSGHEDLFCIVLLWASLVAQRLKNLPAMQDTQVWSPGREDPLEKEMVTHSSILAWRIPWTEKPSSLHSIGWQRVVRNWSDLPCKLMYALTYSAKCLKQ